jgi:ACS family glucarate transporter-like MFS transporter
VGAAFSLLAMPLLILWIGWRWTFVANAALGVVWAGVWWFWFRDQPSEHRWTSRAEVTLIERGIQESEPAESSSIPFVQLVTSVNVLLAMFQYAASNITFFISITWLRPYLEDRWGENAANLSAIPLLAGACALWLSGSLVTHLHGLGYPVVSRRLPAMVGFAIGAAGLLLCTQVANQASPWWFVGFFALAIFGVEMTLSPSWSFCMDIGGRRSGAVSGSMNMIGNLGAACSAVLFPYFRQHVTIPVLAPQLDSANSFFVFAATMNLLAMLAWTCMNPRRSLDRQLSPAALRMRMMWFTIMILFVVAAIVYTQFLM